MDDVKDAAMWSGNVTFGECWAGYIGRLDQSVSHAHVAIQLAIGLDGDLRIEWGGGTAVSPGVMIRPRVKHAVLPSFGQAAFLYIYPDIPLGLALQRLPGGGVVDLEPELIDLVRSSRDFTRIVAAMTPDAEVMQTLDRRLCRALDCLRADAGSPGAIARAAAAASISEPRLRYLVDTQIGVPLSQLGLWQKLERAVRAVAGGASLTEAAQHGGFCDHSHFSRVMRRMFGVNPAHAVQLLRNTSESFKP